MGRTKKENKHLGRRLFAKLELELQCWLLVLCTFRWARTHGTGGSCAAVALWVGRRHWAHCAHGRRIGFFLDRA